MTAPLPAASQPLPPRTGVVGGGRMGGGIAHALLLAGTEVVVVESSLHQVDAARDRVARAVRASAERSSLGAAVDVILGRLRVATDLGALSDAGLVIEAVPEDLAVKREVVQALERVIAHDAVIATNTSSLSINELGAVADRPGRVVGLHFFNPVPASVLVEVVFGELTQQSVVESAVDWVHALSKTPIVVRDSPGFASSRLGVTLGLEAIRMVEEGVAAPEDIDAAMTLGYRHATGPLRLTDLVGLDVRLDIARHLEATLGARFAPPHLLVEKVERGELGRKSGRGFYDW